VSQRGRRVARFGFGAVLLLVSLAEARRERLPNYEEQAFRLANEATERIRVPVRGVMQAGTFATVPAVSALAFLFRRPRLAASLALAGTLAWLTAKLIKPVGGRDRPNGVLDDVTLRERIEGDLGWPSGHTAVATTLAFVAAPELPRPARPVLAAVVATVGFGRMYVGAHLPHDIVGGAGLGMMLSALIPPADGG